MAAVLDPGEDNTEEHGERDRDDEGEVEVADSHAGDVTEVRWSEEGEGEQHDSDISREEDEVAEAGGESEPFGATSLFMDLFGHRGAA